VWLNDWEQNLRNKLITDDLFLTKQIVEGCLRITIKSTIDLVEYLHTECGFEYVLTSKFNQDCLEVIFLSITYLKKTILIIKYLENYIYIITSK